MAVKWGPHRVKAGIPLICLRVPVLAYYLPGTQVNKDVQQMAMMSDAL